MAADFDATGYWAYSFECHSEILLKAGGDDIRVQQIYSTAHSEI